MLKHALEVHFLHLLIIFTKSHFCCVNFLHSVDQPKIVEKKQELDICVALNVLTTLRQTTILNF